jgi:glycoside hydrolase-like protein
MGRIRRGRFLAARAVGLGLGIAVVAGGRAGAAIHSQTRSPEPLPRHWAFDTCEAPSLDAMRAWHGNSPYGSVAVYIGGEMRACSNAALDTPGWVTTVLQDGWGVIPIYVGPQAPCSDFHAVINAANPDLHGLFVGFAAAQRARAAGVPEGSPIYLDVESWLHTDAACDAAVRTFIDNWVEGVHYFGYQAGLYSTPSTGIRVESEALGPDRHRVDAIWVARWNGVAGRYETTVADFYADRRIHQYWGDHMETWGGVTMEVDSNLVEGPVARYSTGR